jgi:hypothetical protein
MKSGSFIHTKKESLNEQAPLHNLFCICKSAINADNFAIDVLRFRCK